MKLSNRFIVIGTLVAVVIAVGATWAPSQADDPTYSACVNNSSGNIFMVGQDEQCKNNEHRIVWNSQGPAGADGADGTDGATGPQGPPGPPPLS